MKLNFAWKESSLLWKIFTLFIVVSRQGDQDCAQTYLYACWKWILLSVKSECKHIRLYLIWQTNWKENQSITTGTDVEKSPIKMKCMDAFVNWKTELCIWNSRPWRGRNSRYYSASDHFRLNDNEVTLCTRKTAFLRHTSKNWMMLRSIKLLSTISKSKNAMQQFETCDTKSRHSANCKRI